MAELKVFLNGELHKTLSLSESEEYIFGRDKECDFVIKKQNGISRQHFKVFFNGSQWAVEVLSRYGGMTYQGANFQDLPLENGTSFSLASYEFIFAEEQLQEEPQSDHSPNALVAQASPKPNIQNDRTVVEESKGSPYLRMTDAKGQTNQMRLEGNVWTAGRDTSCEIVIKDRGASRRHFELSLTGGTGFIVDLNSANGTLVNGEKIPTEQSTPLKSGDIISVLSVQMVFELKDPNFEKQLQAVPEPILQPLQVAHSSLPADIGAVSNELDPNIQQEKKAPQALVKPSLKNIKEWQNWEVDFRKKKHRLGDHKKKVFAGFAILLLAFALGGTGDQKSKSKNRIPANAHEAFANLTPEKKTLILDTYKLAKNLYLKRNYPLALKELNAIHEVIPFYEDSRKMAAECKQYIDIREQQEYIARQKQAAAELERRINAKVFECEKKMTSTTTIPQLHRCLGRALDLNPDHPQIRRLHAVIEEREAEAQRLAQQKAEYNRLVQKGRKLYNKARGLHNRGKDYSAIKSYNRFLRAGHPDPSGLRRKAKRSIASLKKNIDFKIESLVRRSQSYFDQSNYQKAMSTLEETAPIDPNNRLVYETRQKFQKQISRQMKTIYQDSVLEESLGNIEAAKDKWRKIKELSYPADPYYQKALAKLKKTGG